MGDLAFLRQVAVFTDLSDEQLRQLESISGERSFQKNELVCRLPEAGSSVYVIKQGTVKVSVQDKTGREIILYIARAGEFFCETSLFDGGSQFGTATALEACRALVLIRDRFLDFIGKHPRALLRMLSTLAARLRRAEDRIRRLAFADAYEKVASAVLDMLQETKIPLGAGVEVPLALTHQELASLVGVSRETFTRVIARFQKAGLIRIQNRRIVIVNPDRLKREATRSGSM